MDHKLFLEKLTEVCDWEYRQHQGQTNHNWRAETDEDPPQYIHINRLKNDQCCPEQDHHPNTLIKSYTYQRKTFFVERCPNCNLAKTKNSEWFEIRSVSNLGSQAYYKEFGGEPKEYKNSKSSIMISVSEDGRYTLEESGSSLIRKLIDK